MLHLLTVLFFAWIICDVITALIACAIQRDDNDHYARQCQLEREETARELAKNNAIYADQQLNDYFKRLRGE